MPPRHAENLKEPQRLGMFELVVAEHGLHIDPRVEQRHEVLRQVARPVPLVRMRRIAPFRSMNDVAGAGKRRPQGAAGVALGETAGLVEVEVRG